MANEVTSERSRFQHVDTFTDDDGAVLLQEREPYYYRDRDDNIQHEAVEGDTWWSLAAYYYWDVTLYAGELWWVIADYQPTPVANATAPITPGKLVIIPNPSVVISEILGAPVEVYL